jgi:hypothetical protein
MKDTVEIKVPGTASTITTNRVYYVREKMDSNAPEAFQKEGINKYPLLGIDENIVVPWDDIKKVWNTGFYEDSLCYKNIDRVQVKDTVAKFKESIITELENYHSFDITNYKQENNKNFDKFFPRDSKEARLKGGNIYNTKDAHQFVALFWALINRQLAFEVDENHPDFVNASYILIDKQQNSTIEQDRDYEKSLSESHVIRILANRPGGTKLTPKQEHLQQLFKYLDFDIEIEDLNTKSVLSMFSKWIKNSGTNYQNAIIFNETFDYFEDKDNLEELDIYTALLKEIKTGYVKFLRQDFYLGEINLGTNKKEAAKRINGSQELKAQLLKL